MELKFSPSVAQIQKVSDCKRTFKEISRKA